MINWLKESVTYREIYNEGRILAARRILVLLGKQRFGELVCEETRKALEAIQSLKHLEKLVHRLDQFRSWKELVAHASEF